MNIRELDDAIAAELRASQDYGGRGFISAKWAPETITPSTVETILISNGVQYAQSLAEEVASIAPRLFALLVKIQRERKIRELREADISDADLPLTREQLSFLEENKIVAFLEEQHSFPPILGKRKDIRVKGKAALPFLQFEKINRGAYGTVSSVEIAGGHLAGFDQVGTSS